MMGFLVDVNSLHFSFGGVETTVGLSCSSSLSDVGRREESCITVGNYERWCYNEVLFTIRGGS